MRLPPGGVLASCVFPICEKDGGPPYALTPQLVRGLLETTGLVCESVEVSDAERHRPGQPCPHSCDYHAAHDRFHRLLLSTCLMLAHLFNDKPQYRLPSTIGGAGSLGGAGGPGTALLLAHAALGGE